MLNIQSKKNVSSRKRWKCSCTKNSLVAISHGKKANLCGLILLFIYIETLSSLGGCSHTQSRCFFLDIPEWRENVQIKVCRSGPKWASKLLTQNWRQYCMRRTKKMVVVVLLLHHYRTSTTRSGCFNPTKGGMVRFTETQARNSFGSWSGLLILSFLCVLKMRLERERGKKYIILSVRHDILVPEIFLSRTHTLSIFKSSLCIPFSPASQLSIISCS